MSNYPKLIEDTGVILNEGYEPMATGDTFSRYLVWDTGRDTDRYVRQCLTAYTVAHCASWERTDLNGHMDYDRYQEFLSSGPTEDHYLSFDVQCVMETAVYDSEDDIDPQDYDYAWVSDHLIEWESDGEEWARAYIARMLPEHVAPTI